MRFAFRRVVIRWTGGSLPGWTALTSEAIGPPTMPRMKFILVAKTLTALQTITGWPDRYGGRPTSQAVFNPIGGPSDDLCPAPFDQAACVAALTAGGAIPTRDVLVGPPQQITGPLANEAADSSFTGIDFVPDVFVGGPVQPGAALYSLEGDFGFSPPNSSNPDAEIGHEVKLINFNQLPGSPLALRIQNFAR